MAIYIASHYAPNNSIVTLAQITAAATASDVIQMITDDGKVIYLSAVFAVTIATIDTNVVVRIQGSLDNSNWFNVDEDEQDVTYTANGTYALRYQGKGEVRYLRLYVVSESGGTLVTVDIKVKIFEPQEFILR